MPVVENSVHNANNVNAGKFASSGPWSVLNAGIYSHSSGAGAVPIMAFEGKVASRLRQELKAFLIFPFNLDKRFWENFAASQKRRFSLILFSV